MTDQQLLTLSLAIVIPVSLLLYSNSRITEAKETLRAEIQTLRIEMQKGHAEILAAMERMTTAIETRFKIHELEHHR